MTGSHPAGHRYSEGRIGLRSECRAGAGEARGSSRAQGKGHANGGMMWVQGGQARGHDVGAGWTG